jgi:hypothetical protein
MEVDWKTMDTAPRNGDEFMVAFLDIWYPDCMIINEKLYQYCEDGFSNWVGTTIDLKDPRARWAPKPKLPVF